MKKLLPPTIFAVIAGVLIWFVWFRPAKHEEEEKKPETEVPVHLGKIARATLRGWVTAYGTIEAEPPGDKPAASARVASPVAGVIAEVRCAEGQRVEKNAILFQLDSRAADVAAEKARKAGDFAEKNYERQKKLMQVEGTSQKLLLDAEQALAAARNDLAAAQTQQMVLRIQAPLAGTITRVNVKPGEAVDLTTVLGEVIDLDRLVVAASVPSGELGSLKPGQVAEVLQDGSTNPVAGSLTYIGSQVDPKTGTVSVRVAVPSKSGLHPGQFVAVRIVSEEHKDRLAAPAESVVKDAEGATVLAVVQENKAVLKPVKAGLRDGNLVEVEGDGLAEGMAIVTEGAYGLPKETKIRDLDKEPEKKESETKEPEKKEPAKKEQKPAKSEPEK